MPKKYGKTRKNLSHFVQASDGTLYQVDKNGTFYHATIEQYKAQGVNALWPAPKTLR